MAWGETGCDVKTGKQSASTILFARSGAATVRQFETVETSEVRGLDETSGEGRAQVIDNTEQTAYYAFIDGQAFSITVTTGTKTETSAARRDESGQWVASVRKTTYSSNVGGISAWGTDRIDADGSRVVLSASGVSRTVSRDKSSALAYKFSGMPLITTVQTVCREYKYVASEGSASAIVEANTEASDHATVSADSGMGIAYFSIPYGVEKFASLRYVSPSEGWSVSVTEKVYDFVRGKGWGLEEG